MNQRGGTSNLQQECKSKEISKELLRISSSNDDFNQRLLLKRKKKVLSKTSQPAPVHSNVLDQVKSFLPVFAAANADLTKKMTEQPADIFDIENTADCTGQVIEMNLALVEHLASSDSEDDDDTDTCSSSTDDSDASGPIVENSSIKLTKSKHKHKPVIEDITGDDVKNNTLNT